MKVRSRNHSLRHRSQGGLFVATVDYWIIDAALTVQSDFKEVHELYDLHLVYTALALLHET